MMFGVVEWHSNRVLRGRLDDVLADPSRSGSMPKDVCPALTKKVPLSALPTS